MAPKLLNSMPIELSDGRKARVKEYDDGSVRFQLTLGTGSYALTECFLGGQPGDHAILKLVPIHQVTAG